MDEVETHSILLVKFAERQLQEKVILKNRDDLLAYANSRNLEIQGWTISFDESEHPGGWWQYAHAEGNNAYRYEMYLTITFTPRADRKYDKAFLSGIVKKMFTRSATPLGGRWELKEVDHKEYSPPEEGATAYSEDLIGYADVEIPDSWDEYFKHLYGLDAQVEMVRSAIEAAMDSRWTNRFHCVLQGPPGCGKSDLCQSVKRALGDEAVMELDATSTTRAGAIKALAEVEILPRVLVIEEIEKAPGDAMQFLLGLMDMRAEIRKTTARATIERSTKVLTIATVNNIELFNTLMAGALASRFSNEINFARPSRDLLERILQREITKVNGDFAWVEPTLDYCEQENISDPRKVIAICLCGKAKLVTGEYQAMLRATSRKVVETSDAVDLDWSA